MPQSERITFLTPAGLPAAGYTLVASVRGAMTIYLSGQVALDAAGALVGRWWGAGGARRLLPALCRLEALPPD
jgi:hypothetical protein